MTDLSHIIESLRPLAVEIDSINLDPSNARIHDEFNIMTIRGSLARYGQRKPVVVNRAGNVIEAGAGTWQAAKLLGWTHIAAVFVDDDPTTATGYAIADNRTAELASWDKIVIDLLNAQQQAGEEIETLGWRPDDVSALADMLISEKEDVPSAPEDFAEYDENIETEYQCPKCGYKWSGKAGPEANEA